MSRSDFTTVRVVGGLLPTDLLGRVLAGDKDLGGLTGADYHLAAGETPREAANRAWPYLLGAWTTYRQALAKLPEGDAAVGLTREKWLNALFKELDYGRLQPTPAGGLSVDNNSFPVSHIWGATPLHLLGWGVDLDKRTKGVPGAAERAPQAMLQELLNRSDDYLWGMLSNGRTLRLLRDSTSLAGQSYVEFDLESMFDGEVFSDFVLLYLLLHQSRVEVSDGGIPADCWLEKWRTSAAETGTRALGLLRDGVKDALEALGTGFLQAPGNDLNERLTAGTLRLEDYQRSLLRLVYRLLFLFVSEDRGLLLDPSADPLAVRRYQDYYSTARLRMLARKRRGARHVDQWEGLQLVIDALGRVGGLPQLGLPGLGGIFAPEPVDVVMGQHLPNDALLTAIRRLSVVHPKGSPPRVVDYRNLGAEELGSIYESLLELVPRHDRLERTFTLELLAGNDRKTSGSYYTPSSLIDLVLDEALDPLLDERERQGEEALLSMTVCDPACGSGHFLVAAARRIATRLAMVRTSEADPTPTDVQHALHDVVARCIYGVDLNPMAAELAKVSLWLEAMEPGRPLGFLDAHIKVGNALLGTTPRQISSGIPDAAFDPIEGDDKRYAASLRKRNRVEREQILSGNQQSGLFDEATIDVSNAHLRAQYIEAVAQSLRAIDLTQLAAAERRYGEAQASPEARRARLVADIWCASFVQHKQAGAIAITQATLEEAASCGLGVQTQAEVDRLSSEYSFFHWHLEFPEIFAVPTVGQATTDAGWEGGFTAMVGNPPWETVEVSEKEFFSGRDDSIARATAGDRRRLIAMLEVSSPGLLEEFKKARRQGAAMNHFIRASGSFPHTAEGKTNTYRIFAEQFLNKLDSSGLAGVLTPTGLGTGATGASLIGLLVDRDRLWAFLDFDNEARIFPGVHHSIRFAVTVFGGSDRPASKTTLAFGCRHVRGVDAKAVDISPQDLARLNPNTRTLPTFASQVDVDITVALYRRHTVLVREEEVHSINPWGIEFRQGLFNMSTDSDLFVPNECHVDDSQPLVPLYEGKMFYIWDPRYATYEGATQSQLNAGTLPRSSVAEHCNPRYLPTPAKWISPVEVDRQVIHGWRQSWFLVFRLLTGTATERTFIPSLLPRFGIGNSVALVYAGAPMRLIELQALWSSVVFDYLSRQKLTGNNMSFFMVKQLACPTPDAMGTAAPWAPGRSVRDELLPRSVELSVTDWYVRDVAGLVTGDARPFKWDPERREVLEAELNAMVAHVYGLERAEFEHILDSFAILRKYDERDHGEFRTKRLFLAEFDRIVDAIATATVYQSTLSPPPGSGPRHDETTMPEWLKEHS